MFEKNELRGLWKYLTEIKIFGFISIYFYTFCKSLIHALEYFFLHSKSSSINKVNFIFFKNT